MTPPLATQTVTLLHGVVLSSPAIVRAVASSRPFLGLPAGMAPLEADALEFEKLAYPREFACLSRLGLVLAAREYGVVGDGSPIWVDLAPLRWTGAMGTWLEFLVPTMLDICRNEGQRLLVMDSARGERRSPSAVEGVPPFLVPRRADDGLVVSSPLGEQEATARLRQCLLSSCRHGGLIPQFQSHTLQSSSAVLRIGSAREWQESTAMTSACALFAATLARFLPGPDGDPWRGVLGPLLQLSNRLVKRRGEAQRLALEEFRVFFEFRDHLSRLT